MSDAFRVMGAASIDQNPETNLLFYGQKEFCLNQGF